MKKRNDNNELEKILATFRTSLQGLLSMYSPRTTRKYEIRSPQFHGNKTMWTKKLLRQLIAK